MPPLPAVAYAALRRVRIDLGAFFQNFPIWADYPDAQAYHLASQNLATLLMFRRPAGPVIVTVHDIIPYMLRNDRALSSYRTVFDRFFDWLSLQGVRRADRLVADSHYTRDCLVRHLHIAPERIDVVYLGVDHERFHPRDGAGVVAERYGLDAGKRYLLYVGSADPRKNLPALWHALRAVRRELPAVELIWAGRAQFEGQRRMLAELAESLGISAAVHHLAEVPEVDLPFLYNLASACVFPSLYEGFGLPALESMASGTPVIYAGAASLPEIVGDAGLQLKCTPGDCTGLSSAIIHLMTDPVLWQELRTRGLARAAGFRWSYTAGQMAALIRKEAGI